MNGNGNGEAPIARAAENALLKLLARLAVVGGLPVVLGTFGYMSSRIVSATDENTRAVIRLEQGLEGLRTQIPQIVGTLNGRLDAHVQRLDSADRRNDRQDGQIDDLQKRIYPLTRTP
jgi:hypothetical protein